MKLKNKTTLAALSFCCLYVGMMGMMFFSCSPSGKDETRPRTTETVTSAGKKNSEPLQANPPLKGIDVSHFSLKVDWHKVKSQGYHFAFTKATEGNDDPDPMFEENWAAMKQAGLIRGAYHFYVTEDEPGTQAEFFINTVKLEPGDFVPVVDIEVIGKNTTPGLIQRVKTFLSIIEKHYGARPIIYTGLNFWDRNMNSHFGHYPLWIAEYGVDEPVLPKGWKDWHFWQWKEDALIAGVEKNADLNIFNHKEKDFQSLLMK